MREIRCLVAVVILLTCTACDSPSDAPAARPAARLVIVSGDAQVLTVGEGLPALLVVRVEDADGVPVLDQLVNFRVVAGRGTIHVGASLSDEHGLARDRWTLGTVAGDTQRVEARVIDRNTGQPLLFASFTAMGKAAAPEKIVLIGSPDRVGFAGTALADSIA